MRHKLILTILISVCFAQIYAQKDVVEFLQFSEPEYRNQLMELYLEPLAKMQKGNLNSGWYHAAKTHRFLGFDFSISMAMTNMSEIKKGFYITDLPDFDNNYTVQATSTPITPNVSGETDYLSVIKSNSTGQTITLPNGSGLTKISTPMLSAGIGLPYNTELRLNYLPKYKNNDIGSTTKYGASIKHSIKEYIPGLDEIPILSLAVMGGYSIMQNDIDVTYPANTSSGQQLHGKASGYTGRILVGMDLRVFSAYAGIGYGASTVDYSLEGNYYVGNTANQIEETNPITVSYDYSQIDINFGINAKIKFIDLFADYSFGGYNTLNFGIGYNFR
ncbi:DUF6588 family protein [Plebeiibacterium sediminum]|uniref:Uncharacterized protein n=1 Tax=Plebeiibacterium sediminum TaxID=2992112 RepID=A0AAE3SE12_9BACT|nr:DUF6588 family protein [Plebeiobacterium sediminum]MCW3785686.1 hypothetical protein [Plebeiobacterium sediminum]